MATWTDEQKAELIDAYKAAEPTPENSMEIVKEIAQERNFSPNAVRMILSTAGEYVKKEAGKKPAAAGASSSAASGDKAPRVSKEAAHAALTAAIENAGGTADQEIISKLTGKAAQYFTSVFEAGAKNED